MMRSFKLSPLVLFLPLAACLAGPPAAGTTKQPAAQAPGGGAPAGLITYSDKSLGFALDYPQTFVVLPGTPSLWAGKPEPLATLRFLDEKAARKEPGVPEPAPFTIQVFRRDPGTPLRRWLEEAYLIPAGAKVEEFPARGSREGLSVNLATLMAPNRFHYVALGGYVYRLIPLDREGVKILKSFRVSAPQR